MMKYDVFHRWFVSSNKNKPANELTDALTARYAAHITGYLSRKTAHWTVLRMKITLALIGVVAGSLCLLSIIKGISPGKSPPVVKIGHIRQMERTDSIYKSKIKNDDKQSK